MYIYTCIYIYEYTHIHICMYSYIYADIEDPQSCSQRIAAHYNALQHTASHCITLQHSATLCNIVYIYTRISM